jgi:hypothetical protein
MVFALLAVTLTDPIPLCWRISYVFVYVCVTHHTCEYVYNYSIGVHTNTVILFFTFCEKPDDDFLKVETCSLI